MIRVEFVAHAPARQARSQPTNLSAMIDFIFGDVKPRQCTLILVAGPTDRSNQASSRAARPSRVS